MKHLTNIIIITLIALGLVFITVASPTEALALSNDPLYFIKRQIIWISIGLISYYFASKSHPQQFQKLLPSLYILSVVMLLLVLLPSIGHKILGARRWLEIGNLSLQPTEFFKLVSIFFFANLFSTEKFRNLKTLLSYLTPPIFLIILQPNLSTAIHITLIVITIYYLSGAEIIPLFLLSLSISLITLVLILTSSYRLNRLQVLLGQANNSNSYHTKQIILTISSGGIFGKGLANSEQKYRYLPKIATDSILAIIGEELGFLGISLVVALYTILVIHIFNISQQIHQPFPILITAGIGSWLAYQSLINISSLASLIPLTGAPLPLISYGGSSTISILIALGIFRSIERHVTKK